MLCFPFLAQLLGPVAADRMSGHQRGHNRRGEKSAVDPFGLSLPALCRCFQLLLKGESKGETGPSLSQSTYIHACIRLAAVVDYPVLYRKCYATTLQMGISKSYYSTLFYISNFKIIKFWHFFKQTNSLRISNSVWRK